MIRVKICGITNLADAKAATDAGANSLGFNFYEKRLRRISTADAAQIRSKLPQEIEAVGVFVNAKPADINSLRAFVRFDAAQLHGDETPEIVSRVASSLPVIKAFRVDANFVLTTLNRYANAFAFLLERAYEAAKVDLSFQSQLQSLLKNFAGRPTPLQFASRLTAHLAGPRIYLKREDLLHTGAHKINHAIRQGLLSQKMGKPRIVAETGAGQHGVASATIAAHLGL